MKPFVTIDIYSSDRVRLHAITSALNNPQHTTFDLKVPAYTRPFLVPQKGSTTRLAVFEARFWNCVYRNGSLWACHHQGTPARARWYQIDMGGWPGSGTPRLVQSGDIESEPGVHTFFNSISVDGDGNALTVFARSSASEFPSLARAYRLASDPPGTMRSMQIIQKSVGPFTLVGRWGDYSAVGSDPNAPNALW